MWVLNKTNKCPICQDASEWLIIAGEPLEDDTTVTPASEKVALLPLEFRCRPPVPKSKDKKRTKKRPVLPAYHHTSTNIGTITKLTQIECTLCSEPRVFPNLKPLQVHLAAEHGSAMCDVCVASNTKFFAEQRPYSLTEIKHHHEHGLADELPFRGHPMCPICRDPFFSKDDLYTHMCQRHAMCTMCSTPSRECVFLRHDHDLALHFRKTHYVCSQEACMARSERDIAANVFRNDIEFASHVLSEHLQAIHPTLADRLTKVGLVAIPRPELPFLAPGYQQPRTATFAWEQDDIAPVTAETRRRLLAAVKASQTPSQDPGKTISAAGTAQGWIRPMQAAGPKKKSFATEFPRLADYPSPSQPAHTPPHPTPTEAGVAGLTLDPPVRVTSGSVADAVLCIAGARSPALRGLLMSLMDGDINSATFGASLGRTCTKASVDPRDVLDAMEGHSDVSGLVDTATIRTSLGILMPRGKKGKGKRRGR